MSSTVKSKREARIKRHRRVRRKVSGTPERPRLCVYRSIKHIYAQVMDDQTSRCLITVSSLSADVRKTMEKEKGKTGISTVVGQVLAEKALAMGIQTVAFDRGGYLFHGRVKALAEGARKGGLKV